MFGPGDRNLKLLREVLGVTITSRDTRVTIKGDGRSVGVARRVLDRLARGGTRETVSRQKVLDLITEESNVPDAGAADSAWSAGGEDGAPGWDGRLGVYAAGRPVRAQTPGQQRYLDAIRDNDLIFAIGPAGTGKTYLAVAAAVHMLKAGLVTRVILVRPAVEAGEKLGFLPGDFQAKLNPYLRPLLDALHDMMDFPTLRRFMENDVVEVIPLAYMRGRTLNRAVVILDEGQNTTRGQMMMFLTRMGHGSKMIVTGDVTQTDLPDPSQSGLVDAARRLSKTPGVGFVGFEKTDVVRHPLVQRVIDAYGEDPPATATPPRRRGKPAEGADGH